MRTIYYLFMGIIPSSGTLFAQTTQNHFVLSQAPETIQGQPIIVETDRPEWTADQMLRNREVMHYEVIIAEIDESPAP
jgi:hypothetical protein